MTDVTELEIDLIDRINPFQAARAILSKAMDESTLREVAEAIARKRISLTHEEARMLGGTGRPLQTGARPTAVAYLRRTRGSARWPRGSRRSSERRRPMPERSDADILADLGVETRPKAKPATTPREARIVAGFEDIQKFIEEHGRPPQHGEDRDIFERLYAVRLDRLRAQPDCMALLADLDHQGLLSRLP